MRLAGFVYAAVACAALHAQSGNTIHLRVLDGKTGQPAAASNYLVRIDHDERVHNEWVRIHDDGSVTVTLPARAKLIAVNVSDELSMDTYINCDVARESDKEREVWYPISAILHSGVVAPNECSKTVYTAKPGEFVFFVRKRSWREQDY